MPDTEVTTATIEQMLSTPPPTEGESTQAVETPVVVEVKEPEAPKFTDADLNDHLSKLTHDDLKKFAAWNAHVSRMQNQNFNEKSKWDEERKTLQNELQTAKMSAWQNYFRSIPEADRHQMISKDPQMAAAHAAVLLWEAGKGQPASQGGNMLVDLRRSLQDDDSWGQAISEEVWQDVVNTADPAAALKKLVDAGRETLSKGDQKKLEAEAAAVKASVQTKEPSTPAGTMGTSAGPAVDERIMADPNSSMNDKRAAFKRLYGIEYQGR